MVKVWFGVGHDEVPGVIKTSNYSLQWERGEIIIICALEFLNMTYLLLWININIFKILFVFENQRE